ncbi:hypothetical protein [Listeria costaricensis]|uniref:hypothetical protein n=1 Tax=Listeria costaricensis TaxID=2026604 RepID=UPI000C071904|nr:hypothetical protein [Listeria costaricensis]
MSLDYWLGIAGGVILGMILTDFLKVIGCRKKVKIKPKNIQNSTGWIEISTSYSKKDMKKIVNIMRHLCLSELILLNEVRHATHCDKDEERNMLYEIIQTLEALDAITNDTLIKNDAVLYKYFDGLVRKSSLLSRDDKFRWARRNHTLLSFAVDIVEPKLIPHDAMFYRIF